MKHYNYFAYGSNMNIHRLEKRVGPVEFIAVVKLNKHSLEFHKWGIDNSAKADAFYTGDSKDVVYGVLFKVDEKQKEMLDKAEGYPNHYQIRKISAYSLKDGKKYKAFMYYAVLFNSLLLPTAEYLEHIISGAKLNNLPAGYVDRLLKLKVKPPTFSYKAYQGGKEIPLNRGRKQAPRSFEGQPRRAVIGEDGRLSSDPQGHGLSQKEINQKYNGHYTD